MFKKLYYFYVLKVCNYVCLIFCLFFIVSLLFHCNTGIALAADAAGIDHIVNVNNEKELREELITTLIKHKQCVTISYPGIVKRFERYRANSYMDFFDRLSMDNGYYTGIISGYCININEDSVTFQFNYLTSKKQERYIRKAVRRIAKRYKGRSRYDKIKGAHDYLVKHMVYDSKYYNPYYAFKKGRGICMSYALAYSRILQEMKIPCIYVRGDNHAWNMVKLKGRWYNVDVTWDDAGDTYKYFLKGYNDFPGHTLTKVQCISRLKLAKNGFKK